MFDQLFLWKEKEICGMTWDTILCWPEANIDKSIELPCPKIPKFNTKSKLIGYKYVNEFIRDCDYVIFIFLK